MPNHLFGLLYFAFLVVGSNSLSLWRPHYLQFASIGKESPDSLSTGDQKPDTMMIGLSGRHLIDYFKQNLNYFVNSREDFCGRTKVSCLYDQFIKYLQVKEPKSNEKYNDACYPETSIVAKLTRDVNILKNVHSHNDYSRSLPLFEALASGVTSIEADVWTQNNSTVLTLAHSKDYISKPNDNLRTLYLDPLVQMLDEVNCNRDEKTQQYGVFYNSPEQSIYLYINFKSQDSKAAYTLLVEYLKPLAERNYLTYYDTSTGALMDGPVTVILTGNYHSKLESSKRPDRVYTFFDAPLNALQDKKNLYQAGEVSLVASGSWKELLNSCGLMDISESVAERYYGKNMPQEDEECIKNHVSRAHQLGLKTRMWEVPQWPRYLRKYLWKKQLEIGVDYLNSENLEELKNL